MHDTDAIREAVNLVDLVGQTITLKRSGDQYTGKCPFHDDQHDSLSVSEKLWNCHAGCGGGDAIAWIERTQGVDFKAACEILAKMAGVRSKAEPPNPSRSEHQKSDNPKLKTIPREVAGQYHHDLTPERRQYYHQRGLTDETIDHYLLGWNGTRYTIPVFIGGEFVNVRLRRDDTNKRDKGPKLLNMTGYGEARVFNQDVLLTAEIVVIAEGEFDAMLLQQRGWAAVSSTAGAATFKAEWVNLFVKCQTVYICYDNDLAGRSGAAKVAALFGERARIITLPDEVGEAGDVTDFFVRLCKTDADFEELLAQSKSYEPPQAQDSEPITPVHLAQSGNSELVGKRVGVRVLVAGKVDAPYIVPRKVRYTCWAADKEREACGAANDDERSGGFWDRVFDDKDPTFIAACHKKQDQLSKILRAAAGCQANCRKFNYEVLEYVNVEELLAVPMADRVMPSSNGNGHIEVDETGNEYVSRNLYLLASSATINQYYEIIGRVYPHPDTQLATVLITEQKPMQDNISQFALTPEVIERFRIFRPEGDIIEHLNKLLADLTDNVTRIYKRDEALLAILLAYHSVLNFEFEGRPIRRGWLEVLLLGDTGLGKTEIVRNIMEHVGLGAFVSGESSSRTGLTYSVQQIGERWFVKWGKYPLNDRRLLAVDELSELKEEDLGQMTQGRNDGVLRVDRAGIGEANCRTRLVWMSNPRWKKGLYDFSHGIEALKTLFPTPADLRRLDLAVFLAARDIDLREINRLHVAPSTKLISSEALRQSVLWAWSRKIDDVVIDEAATTAILAEASRLSDIYGAAEDIPLVSPADMRVKLARLTVALAALLHSTDELHEKVIVKPVHVQVIGAYLDSIYRHTNCRYDVYAGYARSRIFLDDEEQVKIAKELRDLDYGGALGTSSTISQDILMLYRQNNELTTAGISDLLDIDRKTVAKRIKVLQMHGLIIQKKNGYHKTPKFVEYLCRTEGKQDASD